MIYRLLSRYLPKILGFVAAEMAAQQVEVAAVGLEGEVGDVADDRDDADPEVEADVEQHPGERAARGAEPVGLEHDVEGDDRRDPVADAGHQADQRVEAEAEAARQAEAAVEQGAQGLEPAQHALGVDLGGRHDRGLQESPPSPAPEQEPGAAAPGSAAGGTAPRGAGFRGRRNRAPRRGVLPETGTGMMSAAMADEDGHAAVCGADPTPEALEEAGLRYVSDGMPGIARRRAGKGFAYRAPDGQALRDADTLRWIRSLAIPPAWKDVWISPFRDGHLLATGRDE